MPRPLPEHAVATLLKQCFKHPSCQRIQQRSANTTLLSHRTVNTFSLSRQRRKDVAKATSTNSIGRTISTDAKSEDGPQKIAILGGGISGIAAAHYISRDLPNAEVTIYEGSDRLGGWMKSQRVDVGDKTVLFEQGPRSLRPNPPAGLVTLDIINNLGLESNLLVTSKDSVAAQSRFVYYPDHLVRMPGPGQDLYTMLWTLMSEPIFKGLFKSGAFEISRPRRPSSLQDESIGSFLKRRLGSSNIGDNIVSAVFHGIYAGDIHRLSMKSLMSKLWEWEGEHGNLSEGAVAAMQPPQAHKIGEIATRHHKDTRLRKEMEQRLKGSDLAERVHDASVYTLKSGLEGLLDAMVTKLVVNGKITLKTKAPVTNLELASLSSEKPIRAQITVFSNSNTINYDHVISTISAVQLSSITSNKLPTLKDIRSVTVMVVNLFFADQHLLREPGFGYLIPQSISYDQNPECALGVVFDTYSCFGQDTATGTKITVMIGGHWWDGFRDDEYPTESEGENMARAILKRHLQIDAAPEKVLVGLQKDCIPQYEVGHEARIKQANADLLYHFKGKVSVAGSSYHGVGVNDCVRSAYEAVRTLKEQSPGP